ncbi:Dehydrogenase (flavoprotein) [Tistlia consotensis]|uniref:Dehydrogenase (Flavoprotein) n=1 Tax=Tistlia consotensis USBA 355 TaxID=560819 RepID=A0A1Y6BMS1_9PROT|nr:glycine oxidase maturase GoxB [Tistlia consotensis]SMF20322.1 Dehydrogenase (flavoprotein) [Tistlia consotensis USBA 355]SNR48006.1 Dehydrogenase (flavoprotein) [Tistlia consotensis]
MTAPVAVVPVAVVGGGLAGAAACLRLAQLGLRPLWIGPAAEAGDRPGEHLAPAARPLLATLGALALLERPGHRPANALLSAWGGPRLAERNAILHLEGPGRVLDRPAFERDLAALALASRAQRVEAALEAADCAEGVWRLRAGGSEARARFLLDASGRAAVVARSRTQRFRADRLAALWAFLEQDPASDVEPTPATLIEAAPDGWWYAALLADGRLALDWFSDPDLLPPDATRGTAALEALLAGSRQVGRWIAEAGFRLAAPRLASAGTTWLAPAAGEGWAAVGDAAAAFDPLSSHGMTTALWTAITAAEAAAAALAGDPAPLARYAAAVAAGVQDFLAARSRLYAAEPRFAERPFWQRRSSVFADTDISPSPLPSGGERAGER